MSQQTASDRGLPWWVVGLAAGAVVLGASAWWSRRGTVDTRVDAMVVCARCGHEGTIKVGDTPGDEEWPRACPGCHQKSLYMGLPCTACGKTIPLKDPQAERFGHPETCPHCRASGAQGT